MGSITTRLGVTSTLIDGGFRGCGSVAPGLSLLLRVLALLGLQVNLLSLVIDCVVFDYFADHLAHVLLVCELLQQSGNSVELSVGHVVVPADAWDGVLRLEHEGDG